MEVRRALAAIDSGRSTELDGRGVNQAHRVELHGTAFSVKVHCAEQSGPRVLARIRAADRLLASQRWYPKVISLGCDNQGRLVVVRPFVEGAIAAFDTRSRRDLASIVCSLAATAVSEDREDGEEELVRDFTSPWLSVPSSDHLADLSARPALRESIERWIDRVLRAAHTLDGGALRVSHGDVHLRNLVMSGDGLVLVDWDEVALTRRPTDPAKSLWLVTRRERDAFDLDPVAAEDWLCRSLGGGSREGWRDIALLGAVWFLPRAEHLELLHRRHPGQIDWYLAWIERFWTSLEANLEVVDELIGRTGGAG